MKIIFLILFASISFAVIGQNSNNDIVVYKNPRFKNAKPTFVLVVDSSEFTVDSTFVSKLNTRWIKEIKVLKDEDA